MQVRHSKNLFLRSYVALTSGSAGSGTSRPRCDFRSSCAFEYLDYLADGDVSGTADQEVSATVVGGSGTSVYHVSMRLSCVICLSVLIA